MAAGELVDLVDDSDRVVGTATLGACLEEGLLHRAVDVIVRRTDGTILMQRRSKKDLGHPGLWTLSSTGHVRKGEGYAQAARRELWEELGLRAHLKPFSKLLLPPIRSRGMIEWEWLAVYTGETDGDPNIDPVEVDSVRAFAPSKLRTLLSGRLLTPDARVVLRLYIAGRPGSIMASKAQPG